MDAQGIDLRIHSGLSVTCGNDVAFDSSPALAPATLRPFHEESSRSPINNAYLEYL
jgi:hypothetical protein